MQVTSLKFKHSCVDYNSLKDNWEDFESWRGALGGSEKLHEELLKSMCLTYQTGWRRKC